MQELQERTESRECVVLENEDQRMFAILHRPTAVLCPPLVCVFHGFASSKQGSNRSYVYLAENLSKAGIATLRFDFRGSGDSEGNLSDITFQDMLADVRVVFDFIDKLDGIDSSRLGLFGASLGGAVAVLSQEVEARAKTMVLWAPVASGELWYRDILKQNPELKKADPTSAFESFRGIKLHPEFREQFGKMNAAKALGSYPYPILHMHGDHDITLSLAHQEAYRTLAPDGSCFFTYPATDHRLGFVKIFPEVIKESVNWFKRYL